MSELIINGNTKKLRAILKEAPRTSEELAKLMGLPIDSVRFLIHTSKGIAKQRTGCNLDRWHLLKPERKDGEE